MNVENTSPGPVQVGNDPTPPSPSPSQSHHHPRKNHRGGAKEHVRRERKVSGPITPTASSNSMSPVSAVFGARSKSHRAGVKYRARREARALYKMTPAGMELIDPLDEDRDDVQEEYVDSDSHSINGDVGYIDDNNTERHSEHDTPSLTYDSDEHEEEHDELEVPDEIPKASEVKEAVDSSINLVASEEALSYEENVEAKANLGRNESDQLIQETLHVLPPMSPALALVEKEEVVREKPHAPALMSPVVTAVEKELSAPKPNATQSLPDPKKHPIKLLSLMRPKVL